MNYFHSFDTYDLQRLVGYDRTMRDALIAADVEIGRTFPNSDGGVTFEIPTPDGDCIFLGGAPCDDNPDQISWTAYHDADDRYVFEGTDMAACVATIAQKVAP